MEKAYRYRIYPNKQQQELIQKTFSCVRFVYNHYLSKRKEMYANDKITFTYNMCSKDLTSLKKKYEWLREPDKNSLQKSLKDLDSAYQKFFREHTGYPKFKSKKDRHKSYRTSCVNNNIRFEVKHIRLPKLGLVKIRDKQIPQGRILNATISQEPDGRYYCSLCCTDVQLEHYPKTNKNVGIDLGICDFAILSDGSKIKNPQFYEKSEKKLAKLQRELSRKTIGSSNWNKARIKVAKLQSHIANQRKDWIHKLSTELANEYDYICVEDINMQNMAQSLNLGKSTNDNGFGMFRTILAYKLADRGKKLIKIDKWFPSSKMCRFCGAINKNLTLADRVWTCECGEVLNRDENAAINIRNVGLSMV